jgi:hypothetical protein
MRFGRKSAGSRFSSYMSPMNHRILQIIIGSQFPPSCGNFRTSALVDDGKPKVSTSVWRKSFFLFRELLVGQNTSATGYQQFCLATCSSNHDAIDVVEQWNNSATMPSRADSPRIALNPPFESSLAMGLQQPFHMSAWLETITDRIPGVSYCARDQKMASRKRKWDQISERRRNESVTACDVMSSRPLRSQRDNIMSPNLMCRFSITQGTNDYFKVQKC